VIERLVARTHGNEYKIRTTVQGILYAAHVGLEVVHVETKPGSDWTLADILEWKRIAKTAGIGLVVKCMDSWPKWRRVRRLCRLAGVRFRRIYT
jgi:hypothetical protein